MEWILPLLTALNTLILLFIILRQPTDNALRFEQIEKAIERLFRHIGDEGQSQRLETSKIFTELRSEILNSFKGLADSLLQQMKVLADLQKHELERFGISIVKLTDSNEKRQDQLKNTIETRLSSIQESNSKKLEEMRLTVDEKLQGTLEKRLGESFKLVSERLELVQKGLGEMQNLAVGVGDLKKVLSNVKTRGTWGEFQLGNLLEEMLSPDQFERNVQIRKRSPEVVEFAVRLPGGSDDISKVVYLPIDSKFPKEDYERLQLAQEQADAAAAESAGAALETQIKKSARDIRDKYIHPPYSTDFAILFLPIESLFAEVLRRPGLCETLQREYRIAIAGPTTLAALLNSLQMGFRTLAIQKSSSEVWKVLSGVKSEFGKFGDILDKVTKQLETTQKSLGDAVTKSRSIERKLNNVEIIESSKEGSGETAQLVPQLLVAEGAPPSTLPPVISNLL